jgi:nucleoside-diphosphate-sugar epimerase
MNRELWDNKDILVTDAGGFKRSHLVEKLSETNANIVSLNLASKNVMSVTEIVDRICKVLDSPAKVEILDQVKAEIPEQYLDGSKIKKIIGWESKAIFDEASKETFAWFKHILR